MVVVLLACALVQSANSDDAFLERVLHPTAALIEQAIGELSAPEFAVRERATVYLWCCGPRAKEALQKALQRGDIEVRTRARQVLQAIQDGKMLAIADARLRGVMKCRLGNWREGREALADADALNLLKDMAAEFNSQEALAARERLNLQSLEGLSEEDKSKILAKMAHARAWHQALEKRDWAALYKLAEKIEQGWLRGTTLRLAILNELRREAEAPAVLQEMLARVASEPVMCGHAAGELIMAERPEDALALNMEQSRISAMCMLADDLRFRESFAAVGITLPLQDPESWMEKLWADQPGAEGKDIHWAGRVWQAAFVARTAARLGEEAIAIRFMNKASELAEKNPDGNSLATIWEHELAIGLEDRAWKHFAATLKDQKAEDRNAALSWQHREAAGIWWDFLSIEKPEAPIGELAKTVVSLLDPTKSPAYSTSEVRTFIDRLCAYARRATGEKQVNALQAAAETADIHKLKEVAHGIWTQAEERNGSGRSALALADYFAAKEQWNNAALWYGRAWSRDRTQLFALILQAKSLENAGRREEASRARLVAELWPTGDDRERMQIPFLLQFRGQMSEAHDQYALAKRLVQHPFEWVWIFMSDAEQQVASAPAEAAEMWNLVRMMSFGDNVMLRGDEVEGLYTGYEEVVQRIHHLRARSKIASRDFEAALAEALVAEAAQPSGSKLALELVTYFDEAGAKKNGDRVFEKMWSRRQRVLDDFPKAAEFHEQLAVIGAACRRKLEESLAHAERAVSLRPMRVSSLLALARVRLARGEGDEARRQIAEALAIGPASAEAVKLRAEIDGLPSSK